ncbi:MAG TPA: Nramp family divalent metal transporter [Chitinophagaceae bacterium]|nr:Nramp family divalent metal transporter [Chitinophagaceae bacterium]
MNTRQQNNIIKINKSRHLLPGLLPGIITAALVFGPSKITITCKLGAEYGFSLLWIVVVAIFFMIVFTTMSARVGLASTKSLITLIKYKWGKPAGVFTGIGVFLVSTSFQAGNAIGIGISLSGLTGTPVMPWVIIFNIAAIALLFARSFYKALEKIMLLLIGAMLLAFITTAVLSRPPATDIFDGFIPSVPQGSGGLIIAFMASCFSIAGAFYQAYLVQQRRKLFSSAQNPRSSVAGMLILGLLAAALMICSASVLHSAGGKINTALDMAGALQPLLGKSASIFFLCGLFGASFSALIGNASLGGTLLSDALGYADGLDAKASRYCTALVIIMGASVAVIFGKLPLQLIIFAQSITIFIVPFIGFALYMVANDAGIMGAYKNKITAKISGGAGLLMVAALAVENIRELFFR